MEIFIFNLGNFFIKNEIIRKVRRRQLCCNHPLKNLNGMSLYVCMFVIIFDCVFGVVVDALFILT